VLSGYTHVSTWYRHRRDGGEPEPEALLLAAYTGTRWELRRGSLAGDNVTWSFGSAVTIETTEEGGGRLYRTPGGVLYFTCRRPGTQDVQLLASVDGGASWTMSASIPPMLPSTNYNVTSMFWADEPRGVGLLVTEMLDGSTNTGGYKGYVGTHGGGTSWSFPATPNEQFTAGINGVGHVTQDREGQWYMFRLTSPSWGLDKCRKLNASGSSIWT
jgi:hypothetical protein